MRFASDVATRLRRDGGGKSVCGRQQRLFFVAVSCGVPGRIAMAEGLPQCDPVLLEPIEKITIVAPSSATSKITSMLSGRRGQILGFDAREGWAGWDRIEAYLPQAERHDLIVDLRSLTQGLGTYEAEFAHMAELSGRLADDVVKQARAA